MIRAGALSKGDTFGIIAPASRPKDNSYLEKGSQILHEMGFKTKAFPNCMNSNGFLAGTDEERLADLHAAFTDPETDAIICLRGGYGTPRLLDKINFDLIRKNPKIFVGYSDITALHVAILQETGLFTFHGPMLASEFAEEKSVFTEENFYKMVTSNQPAGTLPPDPGGLEPITIQGGSATGLLVGGNLALFSDLFGTPFELDTRGRILMIEEIGDEPYQFDRKLTQLLLSGKAQESAGIIIGQCANCEHEENRSSYQNSQSLLDVIQDRLGDLGVPCLYQAPFGHVRDMWTLPVGVRATLDADAGTLTLKETALE